MNATDKFLSKYDSSNEQAIRDEFNELNAGNDAPSFNSLRWVLVPKNWRNRVFRIKEGGKKAFLRARIFELLDYFRKEKTNPDSKFYRVRISRAFFTRVLESHNFLDMVSLDELNSTVDALIEEDHVKINELGVMGLNPNPFRLENTHHGKNQFCLSDHLCLHAVSTTRMPVQIVFRHEPTKRGYPIETTVKRGFHTLPITPHPKMPTGHYELMVTNLESKEIYLTEAIAIIPDCLSLSFWPFFYPHRTRARKILHARPCREVELAFCEAKFAIFCEDAAPGFSNLDNLVITIGDTPFDPIDAGVRRITIPYSPVKPNIRIAHGTAGLLSPPKWYSLVRLSAFLSYDLSETRHLALEFAKPVTLQCTLVLGDQRFEQAARDTHQIAFEMPAASWESGRPRHLEVKPLPGSDPEAAGFPVILDIRDERGEAPRPDPQTIRECLNGLSAFLSNRG